MNNVLNDNKFEYQKQENLEKVTKNVFGEISHIV